MSNNLLDDEMTERQIPNVRYADFGVRFSAAMIDIVIFLPIYSLDYLNTLDWKNLTLDLFFILALFIYKPFMEWKYGATFGKMAMKIKVVNHQFEKIDLNQSLLRFLPWALRYLGLVLASFHVFNDPAFAEILSVQDLAVYQEKNVTLVEQITSSLPIVSAIFLSFDLHKQALHDKLAGTYCIYEN